ncbi:hypothetical protein PoB_001923400 [Plakobranchus ocellatus]|uniref:Uncharacterized protein n=1 Tax=Plakobranchus ocellatus TaxID=259542 RepID=A0AAV3ZBK9_9GAST|nr:hypothetical protein PoB_001923400 [Plakobranchus ocellatus]
MEMNIVGDQEKIVEANCSVHVGSGGAMQWELFLSNWLRYCWTFDARGKIRANPPPFLVHNRTEGENITYTYNDMTGPHMISYVMFKRPQGWEKSQLRCAASSSENKPFGKRTKQK